MRLFCCILLLLPLHRLFSQNNLRVFTGSGLAFTLKVGDSTINKKPEADVLVEKITDDTLHVMVEFENKLKGESLVYLLDKGTAVKGKEFKYLASIKNESVKITFSGIEDILPLPSPLVPQKPVIDTSYKINNNLLGHFCELKDGKATYFNNIPASGECTEPMPQVYLAYVNQLMKRAHTDDDRFNIAEYTALNNCLSTYQLNALLGYISFEIEKLKLVRLSYLHLTDKGNRQKLDSTFKLESSRKELTSFFKNANDYKYTSGHTCIKPSSAAEVAALNEKISVYSNDAERLQAFKKLYTDLCYTASDIKTLLGKFIHDREKLDAAKLLYYHCTDKENFLAVSDVFSYGVSVSELKDFVSKQK